ncbi:MAG: flagellin [Phycisphaeraceae bacterium]|nr:flagellin [Phycisphaeraceae bacterium]
MARINSNVPSLIARANLARTNQDLEVRLERLSTGLRINRGRDDPAGLIISERIRSDIEGVQQGVKNSERASAVIATTEAALSEVNDLLNTVRALIVEAANTGANSAEERDANQLAIDSAIDSISRISNTASFGGLKLLDGSRDFVLSGVEPDAIRSARVLNATFANSQPLSVEVDVIASAQTGALYFSGDIQPIAGQLASSVTLEIRGPGGVTVVNFTSGQTLDQVVTAINNLSSVTGVGAELINGSVTSGVTFKSIDYGRDAFVSVTRLDRPDDPNDDAFQLYRFPDSYAPPEPFDWSDTNLTEATRDPGRDVTALVNGALATGKGLRAVLQTSTLGVDLLLDEDFATSPAGGSSTFTITGGGAVFQLGPEVNALQQVSIGIQSVAASAIGGVFENGSLQFLNSLKAGGGNSILDNITNNDFTTAQDILDRAIDEISVLRGRLGAFERNILQTNTRSLQAAFENLSASNSVIRDADFALETSQLTRAQILASTGTSALALANQQAQQVLQLLG